MRVHYPGSTGFFHNNTTNGGDPRIRTASVYPVGPDLQSGAAHAIAARPPKNLSRGANCRLRVGDIRALPPVLLSPAPGEKFLCNM